jgi:hypothetical protein
MSDPRSDTGFFTWDSDCLGGTCRVGYMGTWLCAVQKKIGEMAEGSLPSISMGVQVREPLILRDESERLLLGSSFPLAFPAIVTVPTLDLPLNS